MPVYAMNAFAQAGINIANRKKIVNPPAPIMQGFSMKQNAKSSK
jgi:hypothetical protein